MQINSFKGFKDFNKDKSNDSDTNSTINWQWFLIESVPAKIIKDKIYDPVYVQDTLLYIFACYICKLCE